jgi:hypothetical protein
LINTTTKREAERHSDVQCDESNPAIRKEEMSASAQQQKIRRIVWTVAIASVTATGAWYGAGLKTKSELKQVIISPFSHPSLLPFPFPG